MALLPNTATPNIKANDAFDFTTANSYYYTLDGLDTEVSQTYLANSDVDTISFAIQEGEYILQNSFLPATDPLLPNQINPLSAGGKIIEGSFNFGIVNNSLQFNSDKTGLSFQLKITGHYRSENGEQFAFINPTTDQPNFFIDFNGTFSTNFAPNKIVSTTYTVFQEASFDHSPFICQRDAEGNIVSMTCTVSHNAFSIQLAGIQNALNIIMNPELV